MVAYAVDNIATKVTVDGWKRSSARYWLCLYLSLLLVYKQNTSVHVSDWLITARETVDLILLSEQIGMRETMNLKKR